MSPRNAQFGKEEIVDAAFDLVREHGWNGFSVQGVAKAIGSSTMPIYSQFSNVRDLEDAVCVKALELLKERMLVTRTGDVWIDHGINWVRFAEEEKHLHQILWDGRNVELCMKCGEEINRVISAELADYPLFRELDAEVLAMIRLARQMFIQKLAFWIAKDPGYLKNKGITVTKDEYIRRTSIAIYEGFRMQGAAADL